MKIIVAENDAKAEKSLVRGIIACENWQVMSASDVDSAVSMARIEQPDAVVLEGLFPGGALPLLDKLRSSTQTAHIPVIAIACKTGPQKQELQASGAQQCPQRPTVFKRLCETIKSCAAQPLVSTRAPAQAIADPERLAALQGTRLLDSVPSDQFEVLTMLTAKILGVPVALVSLVDKDRQFFKSQHGLPEPWAAAGETPLTHSFCQWVVSSKEQLVVKDARLDPVLRDNLAVHDLGVVAYAGLPIKVGGDKVIGSFCAIDTHPRSWTIDDLMVLRDLAQITEACIVFEQEIFGWVEAAPAMVRHGDQENREAIQIAAQGIGAIMRLLHRDELPLTGHERKTLMDMVETLNRNQSELLKLKPA